MSHGSLLLSFIFFLWIRRPPRSTRTDTLFPYTTLFRSVRLCDVAPDGSSKRVTYATLNLNHRDGREPPKPLTPGERFKITVPLIETGYSFLPGHRIRVAISTTYWPLIWPSPTPVKLTVYSPDERRVGKAGVSTCESRWAP